MCKLSADSNSYYGELWGSLMHREMQQWMTEHRSRDTETTPPESRDQQPLPPAYSPCEGESVLEIVRPGLPASISNMVELIHTESERKFLFDVLDFCMCIIGVKRVEMVRLVTM